MDTQISVPNKFIISLDPSGQYILNESGGRQYIYNLLTMENNLLMQKKMQNVSWYNEYMFILAESTITHRLNLKTQESYKYKRYNCDIYTSEFVQTDAYIIRFDGFTHNIQVCNKDTLEAKVVEVPLRETQRIMDLVHMTHDVCLAMIINDNEDYSSKEYEFMFLNIEDMSLSKVKINDSIQNDVKNLYLLDMLYFKHLKIWLFKVHDRILLLKENLQEILYELDGNAHDFEIEYLYRYLKNENFVLFEVKHNGKYYIVKLDLINYECTSLYQLDYYSPFLYSCSLNKLIIGNSYKQRGGFDIVDMEII